jgi:hypothetical protein
LDKIEKNETWELVPRPKNKNVIGRKWVFRNKLNEDGHITRNKARLVCKGYTQIEESNLKRHFPQLPEWKQSDFSYLMHDPIILKCIKWT